MLFVRIIMMIKSNKTTLPFETLSLGTRILTIWVMHPGLFFEEILISSENVSWKCVLHLISDHILLLNRVFRGNQVFSDEVASRFSVWLNLTHLKSLLRRVFYPHDFLIWQKIFSGFWKNYFLQYCTLHIFSIPQG